MADRLNTLSFLFFGAAACVFSYAIFRPWWVLTLIGVALVVAQWACLVMVARLRRQARGGEGV